MPAWLDAEMRLFSGSPVTSIDEVPDRLCPVRIPRVAKAQKLTHDGVSTYLRPRLRPTLRDTHDHIGREQLTKGIHVPGVPRLAHRFHDFHVLVRNTLSPGPRNGYFMGRV